MDNGYNINNLDEILQPHLGQNITISEYKLKPLTTAGENYGSQMLTVDIKLQNNKSKEEETLYLVAKMCPPNEFLKEVFHTTISFKKEINIYTTIFPTLEKFQREQGVFDVFDCIPKCYGARTNLDQNSNVVDDDAVLLLENLKFSGFDVVNRMKGFDLATTQLILKDLAVFHAVPIALKLLRPNTFREKILPHLCRNKIFDTLSDNAKNAILQLTIEAAKLNPKCLPFLTNVKEAFNSGFHNMKNSSFPREPFATINHNDYWVNNTMIKIENNKPVRNKMVDFQVIDYGSPGKDIVFLLFSSVQGEVVDKHYDNLIKLYYNTFITTLKHLKCDTTPFTFELFEEEIEISARNTEFFHVTLMLKHILALKGKIKEIADMTEEDLMTGEHVSDEYTEKISETVLQFARRNWI